VSAFVIDNIGLLVTNDERLGRGRLGVVRRSAVVIEGAEVTAVTAAGAVGDRRLDVDGACVIPGFVDSHTHLVFAGDRADEFAARMAGRPYEAGGIRTTVAATRRADDEALRRHTARLVAEARRSGSTTVEVKSGYELTVAGERRLLAVARAFTADTTFLGAHVVPPEFEGRTDEYVALVTGPMLDAAAPLSRFADAFCERGAFDADQCRAVLEPAGARGLVPKVHANQLGPGPGVALAVALDAASADHCTHVSAADVDALAASRTVATLLPVADFSTRQPYADARRLLDAGATVAIASNCNPGSSYSTSMPLCIALAVREMGMTVDEALWAATAGGAAALRRPDVGVVRPGASADLVVLDAPSYVHLAYRPGVPLVRAVIVGGAVVDGLDQRS
jgi:imidazolonepropionase